MNKIKKQFFLFFSFKKKVFGFVQNIFNPKVLYMMQFLLPALASPQALSKAFKHYEIEILVF